MTPAKGNNLAKKKPNNLLHDHNNEDCLTNNHDRFLNYFKEEVGQVRSKKRKAIRLYVLSNQ